MSSILVVDDDPMLRDAYSMILSTSGYTVETAIDGLDALIKYKKQQPDLILLDMHMPNLDGVGFLKELKPLSQSLLPKIIIFSNISISEKVDEAIRLGALRHIVKSQMSPRELLAEINILLTPN